MSSRFVTIERVTPNRRQARIRRRPTWRPVRSDEEIAAYILTNHAARRAAYRNLSEDDIRYVLRHGQTYRCADAVIYFLGQRNIPTEDLAIDALARLEGTTVVTARRRPRVITVYRNQGGLKGIRKKFNRRRRWRSV